MDKFLKLSERGTGQAGGSPAKEELKRELGDEPPPCSRSPRADPAQVQSERQKHVRAIFEQQPFGELERLVTQTLLDVVKRVAKDELENDYCSVWWLGLSRRSYEEMAGRRARVPRYGHLPRVRRELRLVLGAAD